MNESGVLHIAVVLGEMGTGGIERVVMNYYRHIDHRKVQYDFYVHEDSKNVLKEEIEALGGTVTPIPKYTQLIAYCKRLEKEFEDKEYLIVHIHLNTMSVFAQYVAWKVGIPVRITHNHSTAGKGEIKRNIAKYILRFFSNMFPTQRCACTQYAGEWLFGKRHSQNIRVWKDAIDIDTYVYDETKRDNIRQSYGIHSDEILVGHVGRFMPQKNHTFLVEIFSEYKKMEPKAKLMLVGDGKDVEKTKKKVEQLGISNSVIFAGSFKEVGDFYSAFDVFILPSLYEGLGMVVIEAQVSGLPTVISDVVPNDVVITPCVKKMGLDESPFEWAKEIKNHSGKVKRVNQVEEVRMAGYDINKAAMEMTDWYIELNKMIVNNI